MVTEDCILQHSNKLVNDYIEGSTTTKHLFDYSLQRDDVFKMRHSNLLKHDFPRRQLVDHLLVFNEKFTSHPKVFENIRKLQLEDSSVVITGQQAGLLTGPLYTIYKALSAIHLAGKLETELAAPVIPVFWVAGEDHDFQEINHLWTVENGVLTKVTFPQKQYDKRPISDIEFDHEKMVAWVRTIFKSFVESKRTCEIIKLLEEKTKQSKTISDFFIHVMAFLFEKYGLVFVDSANAGLRKIESVFFRDMIDHNAALQNAFTEQQKELTRLGYHSSVDIPSNCAHLFYHWNGDRELLFQSESDTYQNKNNTLRLSKQELFATCETEPEKLSNNVMTRPLMQDFLFPTLAYVAGPGEIAYWSSLKAMFRLFDRKVPPVVPRMSVTIVERRIQKTLETLGLTVQDVLFSGIEPFRKNWMEQQKGDDVGRVIRETKHSIDRAHAKLRSYAWDFDDNIGKLSEKNRMIILSQIDFMERKIENTIQERHARELSMFDQLEACLVPNNGLQERVWNIFHFINHYGFDFVDRLFELPHPDGKNHTILYL